MNTDHTTLAGTTPDPLSAILAEMRDLAENRDWRNHTKRSNRERVSNLADRIEVTVKRERAETESWHGVARAFAVHDAIADERLDKLMRSTPCNAAALRAALERALKWWTEMGNILEREAVFKQIRAALAAPARNCDRFATAEEARMAFEDAHSREIILNLYTAAFDWLFATAEGGAK